MDSRSIVGECIGNLVLIETRRPIAEVNGVSGELFRFNGRRRGQKRHATRSKTSSVSHC
jgi:hypothetical protein